MEQTHLPIWSATTARILCREFMRLRHLLLRNQRGENRNRGSESLIRTRLLQRYFLIYPFVLELKACPLSTYIDNVVDDLPCRLLLFDA